MKLVINEIKKESSKKVLQLFIVLIIIICFFTVYFLNKQNISEIVIIKKSNIISLFISMLICVISGSIISTEFSKGTIKTLLSKPIKRSKILLSKYLTINIIIIFFLLSILICMTIFVYIFTNNLIFDLNIIKEYFINSIPIFFIGTFSFVLSTITLNTSLTVGLSIFIFLISNLISQILLSFNLKFIQYTFLPYLDFEIINTGIFSVYDVNISINKGIIILLIYIFIFYLVSIFIFVYRDIKNK